MRKNIILGTDSYKLAHWQQYQPDTEVVYSYFEARKGAEFNETVFFGLQYLLKEYLEGIVGGQYENQLVTVFEDGEIKKEWNLEEIRVRAQL